MKWRLDEPHFDSDASLTLPEGTVVGDGCENQWRYPESSANRAVAGKPRPPSRSMTPLDDEARRVWDEAFGEEPPERDPTKKIPITPIDGKRDVAGNVKQETPPRPPGEINPALKVPNEPAHTGENVTKDKSVAEEDPLGNRTPEQHRPGENKPAAPAAQPTKAK